MQRVVGIGGLFIRAKDPRALKAWYAEHLGVGALAGEPAWTQEAGMTAFEPFSETSDYFPVDRRFRCGPRVEPGSISVAARIRPVRPHP